MAHVKDIQVYIDWHHKRCADGLRKIALLGDTMSDEHFKTFNTGPGQPIANGWRVAEKMREIANDAIGICDDCNGSKAVRGYVRISRRQSSRRLTACTTLPNGGQKKIRDHEQSTR